MSIWIINDTLNNNIWKKLSLKIKNNVLLSAISTFYQYYWYSLFSVDKNVSH